ncbi:MAG: tRNA (adenosine(37)-N6)-dimethylallyltransferase MiaA [Polyangiales bacterium]
MNPIRVLVIAGPTATGKTRAALRLARDLHGELVGADSVQVYRGFDIGSAKPTGAELDGIPHHLIDAVDPDTDIDAAGYAMLADRAIIDIHARGGLPIIVGGTGLWIRALLRGLVDLPPVDAALRAQLENEVAELGSATLHARLSEVDPSSAATVHPNDALRIVRALEVHAQTGVALGELRRAHDLGTPRYRAAFAFVDCERAAHDEAITMRVQSMLDAGWVDEVRDLQARWGDGVRPFGSVGYREVLAHVRDGVSMDETKRLIRKSTRTYARRQRTWFKGQRDVHWRGDTETLLTGAGREAIAQELGR